MRQEEWTVEAADAYLNEIPKFTSEKHTAEGLRRMLSYLNALPQEGKNRTCGRNKWKRVGLLVSRCGFAESREADGAVYVSSSGARDGAFFF